MARLLFAVHRAWPFPGGSEIFVHDMAKEAKSRGHEVAILAGEHQGDTDGIHVTNDGNILLQQWDLIVVHGCDVNVQNFVLSNASRIPNPILYMIILPSGSPTSVQALKDCAYIGYCTGEDQAYINKHGVQSKAWNVRVGIDANRSIGSPGFKKKYNITGPMFLSCGGYWPNKAMKELTEVFKKADLKDAVLVTTGYDNRNDLMPIAAPNIIPMMIEDKADVTSAILETDCYIMHSYVEGFGAVVLESMLNRTPWIARHGSGAALLKDWGKTYTNDEELISLFRNFNKDEWINLEAARQYVLDHHLIGNTVDDIEKVAQDSINNRPK
jgi:hypothetical protein